MPDLPNMAPEQNDKELREQLQRLVLAVRASGRAILPSSNLELLETIVQAAARIFGAAAASIALVDERDQMLEFKVAYGAGRAETVGMRMPINEGIAGFVAMTGQPMAVSNVQQDTRFAAEAAAKTGYVPRSILATPLLLHDRIIGVMEVLDKIAAPAFGIEDMELLGLFARQAAIAIDQSQRFDNLNEALVSGLAKILQEEDGVADSSGNRGILADGDLRLDASDALTRDMLALADRLNAISTLGDAERALCIHVLDAFAQYAQSSRIPPL